MIYADIETLAKTTSFFPSKSLPRAHNSLSIICSEYCGLCCLHSKSDSPKMQKCNVSSFFSILKDFLQKKPTLFLPTKLSTDSFLLWSVLKQILKLKTMFPVFLLSKNFNKCNYELTFLDIRNYCLHHPRFRVLALRFYFFHHSLIALKYKYERISSNKVFLIRFCLNKVIFRCFYTQLRKCKLLVQPKSFLKFA